MDIQQRPGVFHFHFGNEMPRPWQMTAAIPLFAQPRDEAVGLGRKVAVRVIGKLQHTDFRNPTKKRAMTQAIARGYRFGTISFSVPSVRPRQPLQGIPVYQESD